MIRTLVSLPLAVLLAGALFLSLSHLAGLGKQLQPHEAKTVHFDFMQVRRESETQILQRSKPEPPEEVEPEPAPPMPQVAASAQVSIDAPKLDIVVPDVDIGMKLDISSSLNGLKAPVIGATAMHFDQDASPLVQIPPKYPRRALRRKTEGAVKIEFIVNPDGTVNADSLKILSAKPANVFNREALRAIRKWRFKPRTENGQAVAYRASYVIEFKMEK